MIGSVIPEMSASWNASDPIEARPTCPVIATIGTESMYASAIGVTRLVAPGPDVAMHTPTLPGRLRVSLCGMSGALLVADKDMPDSCGVEQRVVGRQDRPAGDAEDDVGTDFLERTDERLGAGDRLGHVLLPLLARAVLVVLEVLIQQKTPRA